MPQGTDIHARRLSELALASLAVCACAARAGPSLDEALVRHRALLAPGAGPTPIALDVGASDDFTAAVGGPGGDVPTFVLPPLRGEGGARLRTRTVLLDGRVEARLGVAWWAGDPYPLSFDESSLSTGLGAGRIYASVERRQWGPMWTGSLILDGGARPVPAIGWRKESPTAFASPLLRWLGPWQLDAFAGQLTQRSGPSHPHLLGARLQVTPLSGLELGASGTLQWGGSGRPESLSSLLRAIGGQSNVDPSHPSNEDPGNGLAGFDARYTVAVRREAHGGDLRPSDRRGRGGTLAEPLSGRGRRRHGVRGRHRDGAHVLRESRHDDSAASMAHRSSAARIAITSTPTATRSRASRSGTRPAATSSSTRSASSSTPARGPER